MKKAHCPVERINPEDGWNYFFGYYDRCPWNKAGTHVLAHRASFIDHFPNPEDVAELGLIDLSTKQFHKFAETTAWNWQQGSQMQWVDYDGKECVIYNRRKDNKVVAAIVNPYTKETIRQYDTSIYIVSSKKQFALTLNYPRLFDTRKDYGVSGLTDKYYSVNAPDDDGVFLLDLQSGQSKLIVSTSTLCGIGQSDIRSFKQRVNHLMFNPSGTRFCFLHRYNRLDGIMQSRLFTSDLNGTDVRLLFEGMISHYDWKDDGTILAWAGARKLIGAGSNSKTTPMTLVKRCLKPIYYALGKPRILMRKIMGDSFYLIDDNADMQSNHRRIGEDVLYCDGHCTFSPDNRWVLTDGYTDANNCLPLFLYNVNSGTAYEVGRYKTPKELDGELRVDLHPRFNKQGTAVLVDSAMSGKRGMYIIDVKSITSK